MVKTLYAFMLLHLSIFSEYDAGNIFSPSEKAYIENGNIITRSWRSNSIPLYAREAFTDFLPKGGSEYTIIAEGKAFFPFELTPQNRLMFYNQLFKFSSFKGMQYFSKTEGKLSTYIINSTTVVSSINKTPIADKTYSTVLPKTNAFFLVRDNRLGEILFESEIAVKRDYYLVMCTNAMPIKRLSMTVVLKGDFVNASIYMYSAEKKGFYFYCIHAIKLMHNSMMDTMLNLESLANRIRAEIVHRAKMLGIDYRAKLYP